MAEPISYLVGGPCCGDCVSRSDELIVIALKATDRAALYRKVELNRYVFVSMHNASEFPQLAESKKSG